MKNNANNFIPASQISLGDSGQRAALVKGAGSAFTKRGLAMFADGLKHGEALRSQAAVAKRRALRDLPALLEQAEDRMQANGITVLWAETAEAANDIVLSIADKHDVSLAVKSKSMVTEELGLNHALEAAGIEVVETDLGEYVLQLNEEFPSHIVTPIIHKSKESVRDLFVDKLSMPPTDDAEQMTQFARGQLRQKFLQADMGISGGNFIVAETGAVCLVTNEGNGRMVTGLPPVHVALVGIEKIVATFEEYILLTQVLPRSATGQAMTVYTQILQGPRSAGEEDGPEHMYVILVDAGRSDIYGGEYVEALACLRCGACLNACPVYRVTGGHAYGWVYPGPIGAIVTPLLEGLENAKPLPFASSLCGLCKEVCPVDIDMPRMLLDLRHDLVAAGQTERLYNWGIEGWKMVSKSPRLFEAAGRASAAGSKIMPNRLPGPLGEWTKYRDFPPFAGKSFRRQWKERRSGGVVRPTGDDGKRTP